MCNGSGQISTFSDGSLYLAGTYGVVMQRQTDVDNGNDVGIAFINNASSKSKIAMSAEEWLFEGQDFTQTQMKYFTNRMVGSIPDGSSTSGHYIKLCTFYTVPQAESMIIDVHFGKGYGTANSSIYNSDMRIIIKKSNNTSSTTNAFLVTYELHNMSSADAVPFVIATAYDSCTIYIYTTWEYHKGWFEAKWCAGSITATETATIVTSTPSGTQQSPHCTRPSIISGSAVVSATAAQFQWLSSAQFAAITGHTPNSSYDSIYVMSGDDSAYRGTMDASIQANSATIISLASNPGGSIRINYLIVSC